MRTYEKYKDSGISWIGKIPEDWEVCKFKYTINIRNGKDYKDVQSDNHNDYPVYGSGGVFAYAKKYLYNGEALLLGRKGTIDKPIYIQKKKFWTVDTMFYGLAIKGNVCKYLYYQALTFPYGRYATSTALPSMTQSDLGNNPICLPSILEQQAIANYLDKKTAEIDKIIAKREKKIELLNELKSSIISRAVTKGINPHAKMKDSGIDWIGEIPEDWEVTKGKYCFSVLYGFPFDSHLFYPSLEKGMPLLRIRDITSGNLATGYLGKYDEEYVIKSGDLLVGMDGDFNVRWWNGRNALLNQRCCKIMALKEMHLKYIFYALPFELKVINDLAYSTTVKHLLNPDIANLCLPQPSYKEQEAIANYLDKKTEEIDKTISAIKKECILYKEYKQSLISEVVTGKRKVID